jgi:hypothetical protein
MQAAARYTSLRTPWRCAAASTAVSIARLSSISDAGSRRLRSMPPDRPPSRKTWSGRSLSKNSSTSDGSRRSGASSPAPIWFVQPTSRSRRATAAPTNRGLPATKMRASRSNG